MSEQPPPPPVPNGPLTPGSGPAPGFSSAPAPAPVYGPAPHRYGVPPAPTYGPTPTYGAVQTGGPPSPSGGQAGVYDSGPPGPTGTWSPPAGAAPTTHWAPGPGIGPGIVAQPALRSDYASWGRRVCAWLIDSIPMNLAMIPLMVAYVLFLLALVRTPIGESDRLPDLSGLWVWLVVGGVLYVLALAWTVYNRWLVAGRTGRSLGKRVMKLRLIGELSGQPIGPLNAFARDLVHYLDGLAYVGYLWPLWDDKRQTFADMLMHTIVIDELVATHPGNQQPGG